MAVKVRRIGQGDGHRLRDLRLKALADAPAAFASTYDAEASLSGRRWHDAAARRATGAEEVTFFAESDGECVGLVGAYRPQTAPASVELVSMWVAPSGRQGGIGRTLVDAVIDWANEGGASRVELWVTRGNDAATRLYRAAGFEETGDVQPLPSDPCKDEIRMVREIGG